LNKLLLLFVLLVFVPLVSAENWYLIGGSLTPNNYSAVQGEQGFTYERWEGGVYTNLTQLNNTCSSGGTIDYMYSGGCVTPFVTNRTDIAPIMPPYLSFHPKAASAVYLVVRFTAPRTGVYSVNTSLALYSGSTDGVTFNITKNVIGDSPLFSRTLVASEYNNSVITGINLNAGESILFSESGYIQPNGDSTGVIVNISGGGGALVDYPSVLNPVNNSANNTNYFVNLTCGGATYYLWMDTNSNPTTLVVNNGSNTSQYAYLTNFTSNGAWYFKGACRNDLGIFSVNTSVYKVFFDNVTPVITLNPTNFFLENNRSAEFTNTYRGVVLLNFSFSDERQLFKTEVNISNASTTYFGNVTTVNGLTLNYSRLIDTTGMSNGTWNIQVWASDTHTSTSISNYEVSSIKNGLTFSTESSNVIGISSKDASSMSSVKWVDRYTFSTSFTDGLTKERVFDVVSSKCPLSPISDSKDKAHFVSYCDDTHSGNWIDFNGVGVGKATVTKVDDYHYTVSFDSVSPLVTFNSVGGVNVRNVNYTWYKGSVVVGNQGNAINEPNYLTINFTRDSTMNETLCYLWYNGSLVTNKTRSYTDGYVVYRADFKANSSPNNYSFEWNCTFLQDDGTITGSFNFTGNQTLYNFLMSAVSSDASCPSGFTRAKYFRVLDENLPIDGEYYTDVLTNWGLELLYWFSDGNINYTYNFDEPDYVSNLSICIKPEYANLTGNLYVKYASSSLDADIGFTHRYYGYNVNFDNDSDTIFVYNFPSNTSGLSTLRVTTRDFSSARYYRDVVVRLQRNYVGEGVWRDVQMGRSGDYGLTLFDIYESTIDYRLLYYDVYNNLLKQTVSLRFSCDGGICSVTEYLNPFSANVNGTNYRVSVVYLNNSDFVNTSWSNNEVATITTSVEKVTSLRNVVVCNITQSATSGFYNCNVSGLTGELVVSLYDDTGLIYRKYQALNPSLVGSLIPSDEGAIWAVAIILTIALIGLFSPLGVIITTVLGLVVAYLIGIFTPITFTFIMLAGVVAFILGLKVQR
jgi:hypothetical protein